MTLWLESLGMVTTRQSTGQDVVDRCVARRVSRMNMSFMVLEQVDYLEMAPTDGHMKRSCTL